MMRVREIASWAVLSVCWLAVGGLPAVAQPGPTYTSGPMVSLRKVVKPPAQWGAPHGPQLGYVPLHERMAQQAGRDVSERGVDYGAQPPLVPAAVQFPLDDTWGWDEPELAEGWGAEPVWGDGACVECLAGDCGAVAECRWWVRGQYLVWWARGAEAPPLLTTSAVGTPRTVAGELGESTTTILFGSDRLHEGTQSGWEVAFGFLVDPWSGRRLEGRVLGVGPQRRWLDMASDQEPILARPFFDVQDGQPGALLIGFPSFVDGRVQIQANTEFYLVDGAADWPLCFDCGAEFRWQLGYRYARLNDGVVVHHDSVARSAETGLAPGTTMALTDTFRTRNSFHGALMGVSRHRQLGCWSLELVARLALGTTTGRAAIQGRTTTTVPGGIPTVSSSGLLAQPSNAGTFERSRFAMVPELGVQLHYELPCNVRFSVGYTFLYWSQVMRAAEQIDLDINPTVLPPNQFTGIARPTFDFRFTDYWVQGLNVGMEYRF